MIVSLWQVALLVGLVGILILLAGVAGAYIMFKASRAVPGERFLGGVPKGEVFSIPDPGSQEFAPEEAQRSIVHERLNQFLSQLEQEKGAAR